ncbi:polysaccharide pyruvyl transferase family protein [Desertivirga xinjiangensis]|uniref:polysaccharide pyruvyl transferase family protein n=1 Tax=Desertivirga xinjiangensis TaxID=539206 RepID=UPI00210EED14|nr:polysaccharide pyruvyl transferase family protein [Pedobacter xinjiangensis]
MKVGILTLPLWNNYGGIIQAFALKETLKRMGHTVFLVDYHHHKLSFLASKNIQLKRFIRSSLWNNAPYYPDKKENEIISQHTLAFIKSEFEFITKRIDGEILLKQETEMLDAVVVGSDQVWRPGYTPNIYNYFLEFCPATQIKIAYAASFGTEQFLFDEVQTKRCKDLLAKFKAVSVREDSAVKLCKDHFHMEAVQLLDPTLLLGVEDYLQIIDRHKTEPSEGELFTYILDMDDRKNEILKTVGAGLALTAFETMPRKFDKFFTPKDSNYIFPPLPQWLRSFRDAKFVIADSFHGCIFSIIFNKPFIALGNAERGMTRFVSLLKLFSLEERLITNAEDINLDLINSPIDWVKVNEDLEEQRARSVKFLLKAFCNES